MIDPARERRVQNAMPWIAMALLVLIWQCASMVIKNSAMVLPAPGSVAASLAAHHDAILSNALQTLLTSMIGFALAVVVGVVIGLAIGIWVRVYKGLYPMLVAFNAIPKVALMPVLVLWFGIGAVPATILSFSLAVFPIVVNVATGLSSINPEMEDMLRSLGASRMEIVRKVGIPNMTPYLFASFKIAVTLAFVGSVLSETVAANSGIGFLMQEASSRFDVKLVFAGLVVIAAMAVAAYGACVWVEQRMTRWTRHVGQRR
jgi:NitT/TauT family transport system permease protein